MRKQKINICKNSAGISSTIGLLGGSFNPAHKGHLEMSLHAIDALGLDEVWWLVSPQNPLKPAKGMASLASRVVQARKTAKHPKIVVTDIEASLGTQYTVDTLSALIEKFPQKRFVWLMGSDNLRQIPKWKDWKKIFYLVPVVVFRRPYYPPKIGAGAAEKAFAKSLISPQESAKIAHIPHKSLPAWVVLDNKLSHISATKIRKDKNLWRT